MAAHDHVWNSCKELVTEGHFQALGWIDGLREIALTRPKNEVFPTAFMIAHCLLDGLRAMLVKLQSKPEYQAAKDALVDFIKQTRTELLSHASAIESSSDASYPAARQALVDWCNAIRTVLSSTYVKGFDDASETLPVP